MMMLKINQAVKEYGMCRSRFYQDIADGLMVRPVRMGERARLVPADELRAIIRARIAEKPE
ncbi:MAG: transcriptional regulator, partial [Paucibacter sp.]|nr:transcriptional regulator [Roseateles sp.]